MSLTAFGSGQGVSPADTEIALLASTAALALDKKVRNLDADLEAVGRLARILMGLLSVSDDAPPEIRGLLDPITTAFFQRAFVGSEFEEQSSNGLRENALDFLNRLLATEGVADELELVRLRDACVAISRTAQASGPFAVAERSPHPYRR